MSTQKFFVCCLVIFFFRKFKLLQQIQRCTSHTPSLSMGVCGRFFLNRPVQFLSWEWRRK